MDWAWDPTLYEGSAPHYAVGRMAYPPALADALRDALGLDGSGRLLDVGCGPGLADAPARTAGRVGRGRRRRRRHDRRGASLGCPGDRVATAARRGAARGPRHVPAGHVRAVVPLDGSGAGRARGPSDDRARWRVGARLRDDAPRRSRATTCSRTPDRRGTRSTRWSPATSGRSAARARDFCRPGRAGARRTSCATPATAGRSGSTWCAATWWSARRSRSSSVVYSLSSSAPHLFGDRLAGVRRRPARTPAIGVPGRHVRGAGARPRRRHLASVTGLSPR